MELRWEGESGSVELKGKETGGLGMCWSYGFIRHIFNYYGDRELV